MEQIINDLNVALANMNAQATKFAVKSAEADCLIADVKKQKFELDKRDECILDKEAKYAEYDSLEAIRAEVKADRMAISRERSAIEAEKAEIKEEKADIETDRAELDAMLTLYRRKLVDCDNQVKQLAEDKKNLEKKVIEEITKKLASK